MSSIARAISRVWEDNALLCSLVPFSRVFTGRAPQTQQYKFPYVTILATHGKQVLRSDKTMQFWQMVGIDVWVDDARLALGETIAEAITDAYANTCFQIDDVSKVMDVIDGGPPVQVQIDLPTVKAWQVCKTLDFRIERLRADTGTCCPSGSEMGSVSLGSSSESWPEVASISSDSSGAGAWPQEFVP
jgi:hypothetical protein